MESTLQWGRLHAISANVSLILEVDAEGKSTGWRDPETGNTYDTGVCHLPADVRIVSAPSKPLRFFPRGDAAPAGRQKFHHGGLLGFQENVLILEVLLLHPFRKF